MKKAKKFVKQFAGVIVASYLGIMLFELTYTPIVNFITNLVTVAPVA